MVTTRSSGATKQTHLEAYEYTTNDPATKTQASKTDSPHQRTRESPAPRITASKRKTTSAGSPVAKKQKIVGDELNSQQNDRQDDIQSDEAKVEAKSEAKPNTKPSKKKKIAKSRSGQTKLNKENVTQELASPAATKGYEKSTPSAQPTGTKSTTSTASKNKNDIENSTENNTKNKATTTKNNNENNNETDNETDTITINRAPLLTLWSALTTSLLHPNFSWSTCLSAGQAISTLCAISKGRAIGKIDPPTTSSEQQAKKSATKDGEEDGLSELKIMHFSLPLKEGVVVLQGKEKKNANEEALRAKFGGEDVYERVKRVFGERLEAWKGREGELNDRAFGMYEEFRPDVATGQRGWGRKGSLSLAKVREVVAKG
ncbi:hypothetical protein BDV97DRAFT_78453 [Delphinella strobiligena]|nr:hypothetical protein BDV97DRAFT_78453 [Delphinella strobiligena]